MNSAAGGRFLQLSAVAAATTTTTTTTSLYLLRRWSSSWSILHLGGSFRRPGTRFPAPQPVGFRNLGLTTSCRRNEKNGKSGDEAKNLLSSSYVRDHPDLREALQDHHDNDDDEIKDKEDHANDKKYEYGGYLTVSQKYAVYKDSDSPVIYDVDEERAIVEEMEERLEEDLEDDDVGGRHRLLPKRPVSTPHHQKLARLSRLHGKEGVFDPEELAQLLKDENCLDVCVLRSPPENNYVNQIMVATCTSKRHLNATTELVRKAFKAKRHKSDPIPRIEGRENDSSWIAMDMGNIALHLFLQQTREYYDIESLWALGKDFDEASNQKDEVGEIFDSLVADLVPMEEDSTNYKKETNKN